LRATDGIAEPASRGGDCAVSPHDVPKNLGKIRQRITDRRASAGGDARRPEESLPSTAKWQIWARRPEHSSNVIRAT